MSKSSRNLGAVLAFLFLGLLVAGLIFVVKAAYVDEPKMTEQAAAASDATTPSETETEAPKDKKIALFQTSDIHGSIIDTTGGKENTFQYRLAYIANIVNKARTSGSYDDVILVDSGDIYQGAPLSNLTDGAVMRAAFDIMGYDAVAVGNHEFDWDLTTYAVDTFATIPAYEIGEYSGDPQIPVICADLYSSNNHQRVLYTKDYVIVEKAGCRIALIGYIPDYSADIMPTKIEPYEIHSDLSEFSQRVKEINEAERPDVTIVVAHAEPLSVANALNHDDVDLVTGGHEHAGICGTAESGIPYVQGNSNAKGYSCATIIVSPDGTVRVEDIDSVSITEEPERLYDTLENSGNFDPEILKLSHDAWDSISDQMNEALGYIDSSIERKGYIDNITTTGGNFITGLMLEYGKEEGAVAAFYNRDGFRADYIVPEGEILELSVGDIYAISPFNNVWLIYNLTGEELAQLILDGMNQSDYGDQVSGLTYEYYNHGTIDEPDYEIVSIKLSNGTSVDIHGTEANYRIITSNYNASQEGSVFEGKTPRHSELEAPVDNQALIEILRDRRDSGVVHIPTDTTPRGTCLNADEVQAASQGTTDETTATGNADADGTAEETTASETTATETAEAA